MPKIYSHEGVFKGGVRANTLLEIPVLAADPSSPTEGMIWINSTTDLLKYHNGAGVQSVALGSAGLDTEAVQDVVGAMFPDSTTIDFTYDDGAGVVTVAVKPNSVTITSANVTDFVEAVQDAVGGALADTPTVDLQYDDVANTIKAVVLDSPTVGGQTSAQLQTTITAAIVNGASSALDTLNELSAALGNDPNFAATITTSIGNRVKTVSAPLTGGTLTEVVTHNLNTRDLANVRVYVNSGSFEEEEYIVRATTVNTVTIVSEGGNIPTGRRCVVSAPGA